MTATCQLCGAIVRAERGPMILNPGTDPKAAEAVAEISEFDLLAGHMSRHISEAHPEQSMEMAAVMHLAGKVYAMTWAESQHEEPEYSALREAWRTGILQMMQTTTNPVAVYESKPDQPAAGGAALLPGGSSSAAPPEGSKEKKSVRNVSN